MALHRVLTTATAAAAAAALTLSPVLASPAHASATAAPQVPLVRDPPAGGNAPGPCISQAFDDTADAGLDLTCVLDAQVLLNNILVKYKLRAAIATDGIYGPATQADVKYFQEKTEDDGLGAISVDGILGPQTWNLLCTYNAANGFQGTYFHNADCQNDDEWTVADGVWLGPSGWHCSGCVGTSLEP